MTVAFTTTPGLKPAATTVTTLYTALADNCMIPTILLLGDGGGADTVTVHLVPQGNTPTSLTKIVNAQPLALNERQVVTDKWFLKLGDTIQVVSANGNVVFRATVIENSADA